MWLLSPMIQVNVSYYPLNRCILSIRFSHFDLPQNHCTIFDHDLHEVSLLKSSCLMWILCIRISKYEFIWTSGFEVWNEYKDKSLLFHYHLPLQKSIVTYVKPFKDLGWKRRNGSRDEIVLQNLGTKTHFVLSVNTTLKGM